MEIFQLLELLAYATAFWLFVGSADFRRARLRAFAAAGWGGRAVMLFEGGVAAVCGLAPAAVVPLLLG